MTTGRNSASRLPEDSKGLGPLIKIAGVLALVFVPVLLVVLIFVPFIADKQKKELVEYSRKYSLSPDFTYESLRKTVNSMRTDGELHYYFRILEEENIVRAIGEIYEQIKGNMNKKDFRRLVDARQAEVEQFGMLFDNVEFTKETFGPGEGSSQHLKEALWSLFYEDFKLSVMGAIYKATYDSSFYFQWRVRTVRSALDLKKVFGNMRKKDIIALNRMLREEASLPDAPEILPAKNP